VDSRTVTLRFDEPEPQRLDHFLVARFPDYSRSRLQALIKEGLVEIDGAPARKGGLTLETGTALRVTLPPVKPAPLQPESIPLDIVFENASLLIINKPAGIVVHPAAGHASGTLVNAALAHAPDIEGIGGELRPGVVHRLDKDTSGLILLAKNDRAHRQLQDQFRRRAVHKVYLALVDGAPPTPSGRVDAPIGRDGRHRKQMAVVPPNKGREAVTEYHTVESFTGYTLLEAHPITGRTHQIRVHLAFIGAPIVGDTVYGRKKPGIPIKRHFLHAARITLTLPGGQKPQTFEAPLPDNLANILETLRRR
jgi:23S rRNA pseudouridine1911/1915/1917 synthase